MFEVNPNVWSNRTNSLELLEEVDSSLGIKWLYCSESIVKRFLRVAEF